MTRLIVLRDTTRRVRSQGRCPAMKSNLASSGMIAYYKLTIATSCLLYRVMRFLAKRCSRNFANHGYGAGIVEVADVDVDVDVDVEAGGRARVRTRNTPATSSHSANAINARPAVGVVA